MDCGVSVARVLVLGGYGLIGAAVVRRLVADGHAVTGAGRRLAVARRMLPEAEWIAADLRDFKTADDWGALLSQVRAEAIVNCAGVLQDGADDDVGAVQRRAMTALYDALKTSGPETLVVQISATRADVSADSAFMRTKGEADEVLVSSGLDYAILRPGLVIGPQAYGGTALLRALSAFPYVQPLIATDARIQTVSLDDVAHAVCACVSRKVATGATYDLVEDEQHSFAELVHAVRRWLGFSNVPYFNAPGVIVSLTARLGDLAGWLGWRSPLRSTAVGEIAAGIRGDPEPWRAASGSGMKPLAQTLRELPSTVQERWFARTFMLKPALVIVLSVFWLVSGLVVLAKPEAAASVLTMRGYADGPSYAAAVGGALLDVVLGLAVLWRATAGLAAWGMIATTIAYLIGASVLAPDLWADPLGAMVKAIPLLLLPVMLLAILEDR